MKTNIIVIALCLIAFLVWRFGREKIHDLMPWSNAAIAKRSQVIDVLSDTLAAKAWAKTHQNSWYAVDSNKSTVCGYDAGYKIKPEEEEHNISICVYNAGYKIKPEKEHNISIILR